MVEYCKRWFEQWSDLDKFDIYIKLKMILSQYKLRNNSRYGLEIDPNNQQDLIYTVIEGGFKYISCMSIYFPEVGILVEPTYNFEFLFFTNDVGKCKKKLYEKLVKYQNLNLYIEGGIMRYGK